MRCLFELTSDDIKSLSFMAATLVLVPSSTLYIVVFGLGDVVRNDIALLLIIIFLIMD